MPDNAQNSKSAVQPFCRPKLALLPSRASDYRRCPLEHRFRTIDKILEPPTVVQVKSMLIHAVFEQMRAWPREECTYPTAVKRLKPTWEDMRARDEELIELVPEDDYYDFLVECRGLFKGCSMMENPVGFDVAKMEKFVQPVIGPDTDRTMPLSVLLYGFIDRVDIAPTGEVRAADRKTGKKSSPRLQDEALFQMRFCALV